jgi:Capsule assembly protein Wzi
MNGLSAPGSRAVMALWALLGAWNARAGEPWIAPGNIQVRHDLEFLVDSGVIDLPVTYWPIAASDLANALASPSTARVATSANERQENHALTPAQQAAISRLRRVASEGHATYGFEIAGGARPMQVRTFAETPREEAELTAYAAGFLGTRFGGRLEVTAVTDPDDDETVRLDGSYVAGKFGNWIVTFGAQDRWWGSGWEGSLILSNNARPVPAIAIDRAVSEPFETRWLRWIGPWRLTTFMGRMEGDRQDYDHPLLWGMRISARPLEGLELSVDRTAQWCGEGRSCTWDDFWNVLSGNDNAGENVDPEDEPGNQLASYEIRWASPLGPWDYAFYFQHTGESIDNHIPRPYRSLDLLGLETWGGSGTDGSSWRAGLEWAQTRCGGTENGEKLWDCAYNNAIFTDGYRYYGRPMGHAMDGDGEMYSARFVRVGAAADTFTTIVRYSKINQGGVVPDPRHSIAPGPEDWISLDVSYRRAVGSSWIEGGLGIDQRDREWRDDDTTLPRAWLSWNRSLR